MDLRSGGNPETPKHGVKATRNACVSEFQVDLVCPFCCLRLCACEKRREDERVKVRERESCRGGEGERGRGNEREREYREDRE